MNDRFGLTETKTTESEKKHIQPIIRNIGFVIVLVNDVRQRIYRQKQHLHKIFELKSQKRKQSIEEESVCANEREKKTIKSRQTFRKFAKIRTTVSYQW